VLPEYRNAGLGRRLKLAQRDDALERGIDRMEWTFDPLEIKNAHLNIARLGAIARRYMRNIYGPSTSPLQGGLPTDRLVVEWWLKSERVRRALGEETTEQATVADEVVERIDVRASFTSGNAIRSGVLWRSRYRRATGSSWNRHLRAGSPSPVTNDAQTATVSSCWDAWAGSRTGNREQPTGNREQNDAKTGRQQC